jgi:hypothetical protein
MMENNPGSRKDLIKLRPTREFLEHYFDSLQANEDIHLVFIRNNGKSAMCYEMDGSTFTYRAFLDKEECEYYSSYISNKNKIPPHFMQTSSMKMDDIVRFMKTLTENNSGKEMRMMACAFFGDSVSEVDTLWTNVPRFTC